MPDILVTSPYRPFTLPTQFKAVFNGYIHCGTVDAVDPSVSPVQVYLANEDGSRTPVAQPLRTNAGGFLVYNGQPAKFVTSSNHSLLVRDSLGSQLWYAPNMAEIDPAAASFLAIEALRRNYAEAGYNLVDGSFEAGGTLVNANDVLLQESTGKAFSGPAGAVAPGTNPTSGGFVDRSCEIKSNFEYSGSALESLASPVEYINSVVDFKRTKINVSVNQALRLSGQTSVRDGVVYPTTAYSIMSTLKGEHNEIRDMFINGDGADRFTNVNVIEDAKYTTISRNRYKGQQYHIIQQTGKYANSVTVTENVSTGGIGDFVLANNDTQPGISYDWAVSLNVVDQTDSTTAYGATECRGIGFTSVYGARAVNNSMIGIRGDAASHVENIQESVFGFNYYRDCFKDVLFSGTENRKWLIFSSLSGAFIIGETVTGGISGATGAVLFSYSQASGRRIFITQVSGAFASGENVIGATSGANGIVCFVDSVKTHSNIIGNIFHKSPGGTTLESTSLGVNNYNLCTALIGNTWLSEMSQGVGSLAVNGAFAYNVKQSFGTYRGWDVAIGGGTTAVTDYIENFFECNTKHIDLSSLSGARLSGNRFLQGAVNISVSTKVTYENNVFDVGSSLNIAAGTGNVWKNNRVAAGVPVAITVDIFDVFDSSFVQKRGTNVNLTPSPTTVTPTAPHTVATITPAGNNVCARVDFKTVWRNTNFDQRGISSGSALLAWDNAGVITVTEAIVPADNKGRVSFIISGSLVELKLTSDAAGNTIISSDIDVVINGVNVSPIEMFDTL